MIEEALQSLPFNTESFLLLESIILNLERIMFQNFAAYFFSNIRLFINNLTKQFVFILNEATTVIFVMDKVSVRL